MNHETIQISVPKAALVEAFLEKIARTAPDTRTFADGALTEMQARAALLPAIGAPMDGGLYAGITIHLGMPHALVLLPGDESLTWKKAMAWAERQGGQLPSRFDQLVLFRHLKREFKDAWYWSGEEYEKDADCAWGQGFGNGGQDDVRKGSEDRCRAVRRVAL